MYFTGSLLGRNISPAGRREERGTHGSPAGSTPSQPPRPTAGQAGSTNPCRSKKKKKSEVLLSLSPVFNCRSKLALQAGAACQQLLPGSLPGHPLGEGCPSHPPPRSSPPACSSLLLPQAGSIRAVNPPDRLLWESRGCNPATGNEIGFFSGFARPPRKRGMHEWLQHLPTATSGLPPGSRSPAGSGSCPLQ